MTEIKYVVVPAGDMFSIIEVRHDDAFPLGYAVTQKDGDSLAAKMNELAGAIEDAPLESDDAFRQRIILSRISISAAVLIATGDDLDALGEIRGIKRKGLG